MLPRPAKLSSSSLQLGPLLLLLMAGCQSAPFESPTGHYEGLATAIEYPDLMIESDESVLFSAPPTTLRNAKEKAFWNISLEEVVRITLENSEVIRDIGGRIVASPGATKTRLDSALEETNPLSGVEAALSAFDAQFNTSLDLTHDEPAFNNLFFGGGARSLKRRTGLFNLDFTKTAATGTTFTARKQINYDGNNSPANLFPSAYEVTVTGEFRHPLLQGSGVEFNRIAGPQSTPGQYNGVVLARINTDVALADFELAVRNLLHEVESTYWELYFSYRQLDATKQARDFALDSWQITDDIVRSGSEKMGTEQEPLVRERYYAAQSQVEAALAGSGSGIGATGGVYGVERQLRLLMGLPPADERILRPANEPLRVDVRFDWEIALKEAMWRRPELRRQQWQIKRRELELLAARNFGQARLDLVGLYRWRGFGDDLAGDTNVPNGSAFEDLLTGNLQDWQMGVQFSAPIGNRRGHAAIRHAELQLARERAIYSEQELAISHELATAFGDLDRALVATKTNHNRRIAGYDEVTLRAKRAGQDRSHEFLLDSWRRATQADIAYFRTLVDYNLALANVHVAQGTLLSRLGVELAEAPWSKAAHASAAKQSRRFGPHHGRWDLYELPAAVSAGRAADLAIPPLDCEPNVGGEIDFGQ